MEKPWKEAIVLQPLFTPPSGRGLVIPIFFPWFFFFGGPLPQTSGFRSAKQILVVFFATQARAFILTDRNIFYIPGGGGEQRRGLMPLGLFLLKIKTVLYESTGNFFVKHSICRWNLARKYSNENTQCKV